MGIFANVPLPDDETVMRAASEALTQPADSWFGNDDLFVTWGLTIGRTRDSDLREVSNYERVSEDMRRVFPADTDFVHSSHWAYGWADQLQVRVLEPWADPYAFTARDVTRAFRVITSIASGLREQYPVYDDRDLSDRESEAEDEARSESWEDVKHKLWLYHDVEEEDVTEADREVFDAAWYASKSESDYAWVNDQVVAADIMAARAEAANTPLPGM